MNDWPIIGEDELKAIENAIKNGALGQYTGMHVENFQNEFASYHDARYGIGVSNGSVALQIALRALGIKEGDEVLVPAFNFISGPASVIYVNATPVFVDSEPDSLTLSLEDMKNKINSKTKAVIATHVAGCIAPIEEICSIAKKFNIAVVHDCALAHGAVYDGKKLGAYGDITCFSFGGIKLMAACIGGMVLTNDKQLNEICFSMANHGRLPKDAEFNNRVLGFNCRLPEIQAAVLRVQLTRLEEQTIKREENVQYLMKYLKDIKGINLFKRPDKQYRGAYYYYSFSYDSDCFYGIDRKTIIKALNDYGIPASTPFSCCTSFQIDEKWQNFPYFKNNLHQNVERCKWAEQHEHNTIGIFHPYLLKEKLDMDKIINVIADFKKLYLSEREKNETMSNTAY
jgi:dTDP-4-amino-4,6-dideoxygalactose transaminase